ncbi:phosphoribosylformimino-5-aminoimidazole carboxamide ribotide isomerase [Methanosarcinales archaeon ex4572_44]|nr:MAG: phosphoribosylformimino-5-aminoimidazole carboxamide ribotide isomerase [Methanosarcinales archaeon ex4484_138]PHP45989.1 MAG: phosphoribosylformimino-5-aminoimidazole carboxamide ribotide isomerase [Methanosarcinales archaeon ex4572_44]RLG26978.1 MAG: phosphoribosylformimino-5-aminoimidazole carboxamide ribotide isomerase [Methanosarcinales archaeon]
MFRTIFVLDIFDGIVVHAIRGKRKEYMPVSDFSSVCDTSDAVEIVKAFNPAEVYAADLNRIRGIGDNFPVVREASRYCKTILSCGVRSAEDVTNGLMIADTVTIGTENADFSVIRQACEMIRDRSRIDVNIDLMNNKILTNTKISLTPMEAIEKLNDYPISHLIIIDLTKVGTESGINLGFLEDVVACSDHPVIFGGGVQDMNDLDTLRDIGVKGALIATAIHNNSIPLKVLR